VPKGDGGFRRIHHLSYPPGSSVNDFIPAEFSSIKYIKIQDVYQSVLHAGQGCLIIKRDIRDAFRNVPIATWTQWLLGFQWEDEFYKETCLSFGLATAPFLFNLFAEAFHWILESWLHIYLSHYLDDFIFIFPEDKAITRHNWFQKEYSSLTAILGIPENTSKDIASTTVTVLGITIDTVLLQARLPPEKLQKALQLTRNALLRKKLSLQEAESLSGFLTWCAAVVTIGNLFLRHLWSFVARTRASHGHFSPRIPALVRKDLQWWDELLPQFNGVLLLQKDRPRVDLYTDASKSGLGAYFSILPRPRPLQHNSFAILIEHQESQRHINYLETRAIEAAFILWGPKWRGKRLFVHTDNSATYEGLISQKQRGIGFYPLRHILLLATINDILVEPRWITGKTNDIADSLSRFNWNSLANLCPTWQFPYKVSPFPTGSRAQSAPQHTTGQSSSISAFLQTHDLRTAPLSATTPLSLQSPSQEGPLGQHSRT
jgi:hypothetical protein